MSQEQLCSLSGDIQKSSSAAQYSRAPGGSEVQIHNFSGPLLTAAASSVQCGMSTMVPE